ncbi:MAG: DUF5654 family protein [Patescibacteria group bacterium]|jgi:C4-dicarboxylate transporter
MPLENLKKQGENLRAEARKTLLTYIVSAFAFVAGLAWNEAIKSLIEYFFPVSQSGIVLKLVYAVAITLVVVVVTIYLSRFLNKETGEKN